MSIETATKITFLVSTICLLVFPYCQPGKTHLGKPLTGTQTKSENTGLSAKSFLNGSFQHSTVERIGKDLSLKPLLVRAENQLNYSVFGDTSKSLGTTIMPGYDSFLIEQAYVHSFNRPHPSGYEKIDEVVSSLSELRTRIKKKGLAFSIVISPSKAEVYPEKIPERFKHPYRKQRSSDYEVFIKLAAEKNLPLIDGQAFTSELKKQSDTPVFPPGGIHWSYLTACQVSRLLVQDLEEQLEKSLQLPVCDPETIREEPWGTDRDMLNLLNLADESPWQTPLSYPPMKESFFDQNKYHPTVLIVGDSFTWNLLHFFDKDGTFRKRKFMYYFSTEYNFWTSPRKVGFKKNKSIRKHPGKIDPDWNKVLEDRDAIVILVNQTAINKAGFGFVENLLGFLRTSNS